jgi:hypothetical protein
MRTAYSLFDRPGEHVAEQSIRFSVFDQSGNRAAAWKVWASAGAGKSDVYVACRSLGGAIKTSLHESGSWHVGFIREYVEANLPEGDQKRGDPYLERWPRPPEIAPGVVRAYCIVTPTSAVTVPIDDSLPEDTVSIPAAPEGRAIEVSVLLTGPDAHVSGWPSLTSMGTDLVGELRLDNGETVWVVWREADVPDLGAPRTGKMTFFKDKSPADLLGGDVGALIFARGSDGCQYVIDCSVDVDGPAIEQPDEADSAPRKVDSGGGVVQAPSSLSG